MEAQADARGSGGLHERSPGRVNYRNGYREQAPETRPHPREPRSIGGR